MEKIIVSTPARFVASFINGVHVVFDREWYGHGPAFMTRKQAEDQAWSWNRREHMQAAKGV